MKQPKHVIAIDFETAWSDSYSVAKMPTQAYVQDPQFAVIGIAVQVDGDDPMWIDHTQGIKAQLETLPWDDAVCVAHNAIFDGSILELHYDIHPEAYFCTMQGSRPHFFPMCGAMNLDAVSKFLGLGAKGQKGMTAKHAKGMWPTDFTAQQLADMGEYALDDLEKCLGIYHSASRMLPDAEKQALNLTILKATRPKLHMDTDLLATVIAKEQQRREALAQEVATIAPGLNIRSPQQVLNWFHNANIRVPTGASLSKDGEFMQRLLNHPARAVRRLAELRVELASNLFIPRAQRMMSLGADTPVSIPLLYYGAATGRWSGLDKLNFQNLPARGDMASLREALVAPPGHKLVAADLSQIELRLTAWFADEEHMLEGFRRGLDPYRVFAAEAFNVSYDGVTTKQRQIAKAAMLSNGFGGGGNAMLTSFRKFGDWETTLEDCNRYARRYRDVNEMIVELWNKTRDMVDVIAGGGPGNMDTTIKGAEFKPNRLNLPGGSFILYPNITVAPDGNYQTKRGDKTSKLYFILLVENLIQGTARNIIRDAENYMYEHFGFRMALSAHDELVACVPEDQAEAAAKCMKLSMERPVSYLPGLPLEATVEIGDNYGQLKG